MLKTLIIYSAVAAVLIPAIYETYKKFVNDGKGTFNQDFDTVNLKDEEENPLTPEDIAKRA